MKNSKYDPVTIIGVGACLLMFAAIPVIQRRFFPQPPARTTEAPATQPEATTPAQPSPATTPAQPETAATTQTPAVPAGTASAVPDIFLANAQPSEEPVILERPGEAALYIDKAGLGVTGIRLEQYDLHKTKKGEPPSPKVVLSSYEYPFLGLVAPGLENPKFTSNGKVATLERTAQGGSLKVTETWDASAEGTYEIHYSIKVENIGPGAAALDGWMVSAGAITPSITPNRKAARGENAGGATMGFGKGKNTKEFNLKKLTKLDAEDRQRLAMTPVAWTAVHSKYFVMGLWFAESSQMFAGVQAAAVPTAAAPGAPSIPDGRYRMRAILPQRLVQPGENLSWDMVAYAGPKNCERLYCFDNGISSVMGIDLFFAWHPAWMGWISRGLLGMMLWIRSFFPESIGFGMAVILLTILVRIVFWPLIHKSTVSMRKMQALKPQLDEIKEKYKNDPQTMYRKQRELFKENDVSQLGGCLPMLLQIPVFFALFNTFRNAIELRHAGFLWATDLSMPDTLSFSPEAIPIRPFALLMGITMYLQQKLSPNPDPNSAKMMNFMTIFFIFLFYNMPSALTLYLSVSYLLGILQTYITNKMIPLPQATKVTG
ncbi:MAG: YidC/Oxa1 family insertase periplasmic-domain containing protein [Victivallales bacterium]|nr:YidC/Oxa1 family insertase periplasmic-domain containing protein [Victivallales bacterium]